MSRLGNIARRALHSAALLALLLVAGLALNGILFGYAVFRLAGSDQSSHIEEYALALEAAEGGYALPVQYERQLADNDNWLLLIDGEGDMLYSCGKPDDVPEHYSLSEVAGFTRWYLEDYPVRVQVMDDGLLIVGYPKNSVWKYSFEANQPNLLFWPVWIAATLICNFLLILIISALYIDRSYKKRDKARTEWIAAVSHDVRTPLASVLGYAGSLEANAALSEAEREQASMIRSNGETLRQLIENLNLTNRLQYSMEPLNAQLFSLCAEVRSTAADFLNEESGHNCDISVDISPRAERYRLYGDRALIRRMLANLINNSLRHNADGCVISIELTARYGRLALTVGDNGSGYSKEQLSSLKGKYPPLTSGHGLGLTIVRQIAAAHRGRIRFYNLPTGGAACQLVFRHGVRRIRARDEKICGSSA